MHLKHRWMRALVGLATLPWTLPCLAADAPLSGLQALPDQDLLAMHGAGLDDQALSRLHMALSTGAGTDQRRKGDEDRRTAQRGESHRGESQNGKDEARRQESASAQSQLLTDTLSRQAVQMETTLAMSGAANAVRMAQTGAMLAAVTPVVMVAAPLAMPLFGAPMLPR